MIELDCTLQLASFELQLRAKIPGPVTAVMGPSGSGKTSLLELIAGLRSRAQGSVSVGSTTFLDSARNIQLPPELRRIAYVPQHAALFPHLDVRDNIAYGVPKQRRRAHLTERDDALLNIVELLQLGSLLKRRVQELSGGEAQRVAIARALLTEPRLLLLDEPLTALDDALRERILPYLIKVRDEARIPMLYVTHRVAEALALANDVMMLREGRLVDYGPVHTVVGSAPLAP